MAEETYPTVPLPVPNKTLNVWESRVVWWSNSNSLGPDTSSTSPLDRQQQKLVLSPFKDSINTDLHSADKLLQPKLRPLQILLRTLGINPYMYDDQRYLYVLTWCSWPATYTILTTGYTILVLVVSLMGLVPLMDGTKIIDDNSDMAALKLIGIVLVLECVVNACFQLVANMVFSRRACRLFNSWQHLIASTQLNPTCGLLSTHIRQLAFLVLFWAALLTMTVMGRPSFVAHSLDGLALVILGQPYQELVSELRL